MTARYTQQERKIIPKKPEVDPVIYVDGEIVIPFGERELFITEQAKPGDRFTSNHGNCWNPVACVHPQWIGFIYIRKDDECQ